VDEEISAIRACAVAKEAVSFADASKALDVLFKAPRAAVERVELEAGMYMRDGVIYKVQRAVHGSGMMYAKQLTEQGFEFARGAVSKLDASHRMTLEQAKEYGAVYGVCCVCAATLTDERSIEAGIGPVCAKKF
jgi:ribosomal protein L7/L12